MNEQMITIVLVAVVLGMDALSLAIGMGLRGVSRNYELKFTFSVGIMHILMPLLGLNLGIAAGNFLGIWATRLGALILAWLGIDLFIKGYRENRPQTYKFNEAKTLQENSAAAKREEKWGSIIMLAVSVSIDALTAGFSLGTLRMPVSFTVLIMGMVAAIMTYVGFAGGRIFGRWMGTYAQMLGGVVLIALAVKLVV